MLRTTVNIDEISETIQRQKIEEVQESEGRGEGCWCTLSILPPHTHRNRPMLHTQPHSALQKQYDYVLLEHIDSGFPIKDARLLKYEKSISSIILPSFSLLIRLGLSFSFEKQAPFLGNSVDRLEPHRQIDIYYLPVDRWITPCIKIVVQCLQNRAEKLISEWTDAGGGGGRDREL